MEAIGDMYVDLIVLRNIYIVVAVIGLVVYGYLRQTKDIEEGFLFVVFAWPLALFLLIGWGILSIPYFVGKLAGKYWEGKIKKIKNENSRYRHY